MEKSEESAIPWRPVERSRLFNALASPAIGRPMRKLMWTAITAMRACLTVLEAAHHHLPYVVKLADTRRRTFRPESLNDYYRQLRASCRELPYRPRISVILPYYKVKADFFKEALASIEVQAYENWELCAVDDASGMPELGAMVEELARRFPGRVRHTVHASNRHICATSNTALALATGDYVTFLDHDDRLMPNALAEMARAINRFDQPEVLYSDEQLIDAGGTVQLLPFYKPGWSPFLLLSHNYVTHLAVYRTELVRSLGGLREGYEGAQDHDLMLRATEATRRPIVHVPFSLYQWRMHERSTASTEEAKPYAAVAGERAVRDALERRARPGEVEWEQATKHFRVRFALPDAQPRLSLVVPERPGGGTGAGLEALAGETYPGLEVVVVGEGRHDALQRLGERLRIVRGAGQHNLARRLNMGVAAASGAYVMLLDDDLVPTTRGWIEELLRYAQYAEIGAVTGKILYADDTIEQAGLLLGGSNVAIPAGKALPAESNAYWSVLATPHEVEAAPAACMMIARDKLQSAGGFDEKDLPAGYADVDLCLTLRRRGLFNLYTPYAVFRRASAAAPAMRVLEYERMHMLRKWGGTLANDAFLNPNLTRGAHYLWDGDRPPLHESWFAPDYG